MLSGFRGSSVSAAASGAGAGACGPDSTLVAGAFDKEFGTLISLSTVWSEVLWPGSTEKSERAWSREGTRGCCSDDETIDGAVALDIGT